MLLTRKQSGFTIVELLIVIVVIGILAAITIVAYNGIQDRATYTKRYAAISQVNKALKLYFAENDKYPTTGTYIFYCESPGTFLSAITTATIPPAPCADANAQYDTWAYRTTPNGKDYKLIYNRPTMSAGVRAQIPAELQDPSRFAGNGAWGYWTPGGVGL